MIGGVSGFNGTSQMASMRSQMGNPFTKMDANGDGALDATEIGTMAEHISEKTGQDVTPDQVIARLDSDSNGLISQDEFKAGRPKGPPPGMMGIMGGNNQQDSTQSLLEILNSSSADESNDSVNPLDVNGDGVVDAAEAMQGMNILLQEYLSQTTDMLGQDSESESALSVLA